MFKLKVIKHRQKDVLDQLEIQNDENASYIICDDVSLFEKGKVNILFEDNNIEEVKLLVSSVNQSNNNLISLNTSKGTLRVIISDIYYIQTYGNDVLLYTKDDSYTIKMTLYQLEELLATYNFIRIGKASIVNVAKIVEIQTGFNAKLTLVLENKTNLEVMRSFVKGFKEYLKV